MSSPEQSDKDGPSFPENIKIVGGEPLELPDLEETIRSLESLVSLAEEEHSKKDDDSADFYFPLVVMLYSLTLSIISKYKLFKFPIEDKLGIGSITWFLDFWVSFTTLIKSFMESDSSLLLDGMRSFNLEPFQWSFASFTYVAQWFSLMLEKENHYGDPPFYIYIKNDDNSDENFPYLLPRIFKDDDWISGFGGRFLILSKASDLNPDQKTEIWNALLMEENIYGDKTINHSVRGKVFETIFEYFPSGDVSHLDLCGGKGDFIEWLKTQKSQINSYLIDNADEAVLEAKSKGIEASMGNAEEVLKIENPVDVITILFSVQWLSPDAFTNVIDALKPGGMLIANVYPPDLKRVEIFTEILKQAGFINIEHQKVKVESISGKNQYVLRAKKPKLRLTSKLTHISLH